MSKKNNSQFILGALAGAAVVYMLTRPKVVVFPGGPQLPVELPGSQSTPTLPQLSGQYHRNASWYGNYPGVGAYPMSPQRLYRPLSPPLNYFV